MIPVRILEGVAGSDFSWVPGEIVEMSEEDAVKWADGYRAERVEQADPPRPDPDEPEVAAGQSRGGGRRPATETRATAAKGRAAKPSATAAQKKEMTDG